MSFAPSAPTTSDQLLQAVETVTSITDRPEIERVEIQVADTDPLLWLAAQTGGPALYWRGRGDREARAALGAARSVNARSLEEASLTDAGDALPAGARMWLTARFDTDAEVGHEWLAFGGVRLVLPRVELRQRGRDCTLSVYILPGETAEEVMDAIGELQPPVDSDAELDLPFMRRDDPDRSEWGRMLRWAFGSFSRRRLDKVVLARRARFTFEQPVDAVALMQRLEAATPRCYHALVAPRGLTGPTFVTATPERLIRVRGAEVETEAVAGTRPRAELDATDDELRDELLSSEKDRREHAFVRSAIGAALTPLARHVETDDETTAMTLARGRHLRTGIRATLADDIGPLDVLRALHPTPAVGGTPTRQSLDAIRRLEPFDRGLYAGPIGWIGRDDDGQQSADVSVGIRSGLVNQRTLSLYSGAGIVPGSTPSAEWAEIEHKIGDFARVLGLAERIEA
ncbi:MAG: isochorismate synthase [Bacteroidota bacterium]